MRSHLAMTTFWAFPPERVESSASGSGGRTSKRSSSVRARPFSARPRMRRNDGLSGFMKMFSRSVNSVAAPSSTRSAGTYAMPAAIASTGPLGRNPRPATSIDPPVAGSRPKSIRPSV